MNTAPSPRCARQVSATLCLAVDGAEEEALQLRVAGRRDARQRPVLLDESDGPAHGERCGRARDVREAEEQWRCDSKMFFVHAVCMIARRSR